MFDFIWNITLVCPWDCEFCCTDATHVKKGNKNIIISERGLSNSVFVRGEAEMIFRKRYPGIPHNIYDLALIERQLAGEEPSLQEKLAILNNLPKSNIKIDFAGGDPLSCYENFLVIQEASRRLGKEYISITSTGHSVNRIGIGRLAETIGEFEFTYDEPREDKNCRPIGYNASNLVIAKKFAELGVKTKAQIPIHIGNKDVNTIERLYEDLNIANIDEILLMRTFPVGRGESFLRKNKIDKITLLNVIDGYTQLSNAGKTKIRLQCALKHLYGGNSKNPCDILNTSFGINYQGKLLLSAWANNGNGQPLSDDFILGDLKIEGFDFISNKLKFKNIRQRLDENKGHCKIFSYQYGGKNFESLFTKTDPLYSMN